MDLRTAIENAGGFKAVSQQIGSDPNTVYYWLRRQVPAGKVRDLARILNLSPHVLRPDLYDAPPPRHPDAPASAEKVAAE